MKRLVLEFFLLVGAVVAGVYAWHLHTQLGVDTAKVQTMTERGEQAGQKLEEATKALETAQQEIDPLRLQAQQMQAVRSALTPGVTLKDLEAAYAKEKTLSPERHLGMGALRILTTGKADEASLQSIKKALDASDWGSRKPVICAAQNVLSYAGQSVTVLAECKPELPQSAAKQADQKADQKGDQKGDEKAAPTKEAPADQKAAG
jgi:TolA-binding protein